MGNRVILGKVMTRWDVFGLAFGAMIGWGWVVLANRWISLGGIVGALVAFVLGGVMCSAVGLIYAELTAAMPVAGGPVAWTYRGLGEGWSWLTGWVTAFAYANVAAWESVAITTALNHVFPIPRLFRLWNIAGQDVYLGWALTGASLGIVLAYMNYRGTRLSSTVQNGATALLIIAGLFFIATAAWRGSWANFSPTYTSLGGISDVMMMVPFLMVGFDVIPQSSEEMNIPHRSVGHLLMISVAAATIWYSSIILGLGYAIPSASRDSSPMAVVTAMEEMLASRAAGKALAIGGVCGILTSWNAFFVAASRVLFAMGRARMLPTGFAKINPSTGVPTRSVVIVGIVSGLAPFLGSNALTWLSNVGGFCTCIAYFIIVITFIRLRRSEPCLKRPFLAGRGLFVGICAVVITALFIAMYLPIGPSSLQWPYEWAILALWGGAGICCYAVARKANGVVTPEDRYFLMFGEPAPPAVTGSIGRRR